MVLCSEMSVNSEADVALVRHRAGESATLLGFSDQRRAELRLIASELAHNHLDHKTSNGMIRISGQLIGGRAVITIASIDDGPGIENVQMVLQGTDGCRFKSHTGLGAGLASVSRLADRFICCSGKDPASGNYENTAPDWQGTAIVAQCWMTGDMACCPKKPETDLAALVCGRRESSPCGDGLFIHEDSRTTRIVLADSPGKGRGGGETELIGSMIEPLDLVWPPDHVVEVLASVFAAEPATSLAVVRIDRLLGEMRCCSIGSVAIHLLVDGMICDPPSRIKVAGGGLIKTVDTVYRPDESIYFMLNSDGIDMASRQAQAILTDLQACTEAGGETSKSLSHLAYTQLIFSRFRNCRDDAALCLCRWQLR